ncbi:hypothetical protein DB346_24725 [Verrucomicrobia bacterium LW23]|nr:hypothetical protein DB346_24725 [Verrucomicrobia bacterium LW23]
MLLLLHLGPDIYGLDVLQIVEVIPRIDARPVPNAPDYIVGLISYRGMVVPLLDLKMLMLKQPCAPWLSTRIVVTECTCKHAAGASSAPVQGRTMLAVLGERVTETVEVDRARLQSSGIELSDESYLGRVAMHDKRMIQLLNLEHVLPAELQEMLARAAKSR